MYFSDALEGGKDQVRMCMFCNFSTVSEERLQAHISAAHSQQPKLHCPLCQESFTEKPVIEKHLIQVGNHMTCV